MGETVWDGENPTLFETPNLSKYQPWHNVVRGKRTCTANLCIAQDVQQEHHLESLDRKNIAEALHKRNMLRVAESIQISPNTRFCSIKFTTKELMQTFCTEGVVISGNITVYFKPDYKLPPPTQNYTFVSFLNVPLETEKKDMKNFVRQHVELCGVH